MSFPKKTPAEEKLATFDFSLEAANGTTLSNPAVTATLKSGAGGADADITIGTPSVIGRKVYALLSGGVDGCVYRISCAVDADNGEHHQVDKDLPISAKAALVS